MTADVDLEAWWRIHSPFLPNFATLAWQFALLNPSSAASERVFADARLFEDASQAEMLEDVHQAGLFARVNERNRRKEAAVLRP